MIHSRKCPGMRNTPLILGTLEAHSRKNWIPAIGLQTFEGLKWFKSKHFHKLPGQSMRPGRDRIAALFRISIRSEIQTPHSSGRSPHKLPLLNLNNIQWILICRIDRVCGLICSLPKPRCRAHGNNGVESSREHRTQMPMWILVRRKWIGCESAEFSLPGSLWLELF